MPDPEPINVYFRIGIRSDGDISQLTVTQNTNEITLTREQAISLANEIKRRYYGQMDSQPG
jgi:hypothetical protein